MNQNSRLIASSSTVQVTAAGTDATLQWTDQASIAPSARLSLALEQIHGTYDAAILKVFLLAPDEIFLGSVALYGLRRASAGMTGHIEVPAEALALIDPVAGTPLQLAVRPHEPLPNGVEIAIGRIGLYLNSAA
jgi:hypothetical protein